tara:strand:- start:942 stop:1106 length:165 start_codon:yes stop_codon:yes gene_type:complete
MLCLSRRVGESIIIDGDIKVTVLRINSSQVKIGIAAPDDVLILREELVEEEAGE